jgi:hypothetical protein
MRRDPQVGDVVHWFPGSDRNQEPKAAVVSKAGATALCVNVIDSGTFNFLIRDGVRHVDDPRSRTEEGRKSGAWDFTPRDKKLDELLETLPETAKVA